MIIFLYGEDTYRSRQKLKELKDKFLRDIDSSGNSLTVIEGDITIAEKIISAIGPASLLAKKRMIIVENAFINKNSAMFEQLAAYLQRKDAGKDDNIIIFWEASVMMKKVKGKDTGMMSDAGGREKALTKQRAVLFDFLIKRKYAQQFNLPNNAEVIVWIKEETAKRQGRISQPAAQLLAGQAGNNLWQISNEINKLLSFKSSSESSGSPDGKLIQIKVEDVAGMTRSGLDENIFTLTDALGSKNKALATSLLEEQLAAGAADSYLLNAFIRQFKILLQIKQAVEAGTNPRQIAGKLKLHPYVAQKAMDQTRYFELPVLKNILNSLIRIDFSSKTGRADIKTMLNVLIVRL